MTLWWAPGQWCFYSFILLWLWYLRRFQGRETRLISLKDEYRELENDEAKLQIDYKYYNTVILQYWRIHGKFLWRWNQVSGLFLRSYLINYHMGPSSLFMNTTYYSLSLIRLTIVSSEISSCRWIYWRETSDDDTLFKWVKLQSAPNNSNLILTGGIEKSSS